MHSTLHVKLVAQDCGASEGHQHLGTAVPNARAESAHSPWIAQGGSTLAGYHLGGSRFHDPKDEGRSLRGVDTYLVSSWDNHQAHAPPLELRQGKSEGGQGIRNISRSFRPYKHIINRTTCDNMCRG